MSEHTELTLRNQNYAVMPVMNVAEAIERRDALVQFVQGIMEEDRDFGKIPGTNKPTLLKPGAEKLTTFFGLSPRFEVLEKAEDWTGKQHDNEPFFYFQYKCQLWRGDTLVGEGVGSCNSWEKKYRYRRGELVCPSCGKEGTVIKGKQEYGGGWLCWNKKGGCGVKWDDGAEAIESQDVGDVPNPNPQDLVNTIDKMAQKRALIAATLIAVNASEFFTQDIEDMADSIVEGDYREAPEAPKAPQKPPQPTKGPNGGSRPYSPEQLRERIGEFTAKYEKKNWTANDKQRGLAMGMMSQCFASDDADEQRHSVLAYLFGVDSGNDLSDAQVLALLDWLAPSQDDGGAYLPDTNAAAEANRVVRARMLEQGQQELLA